MSPVPTGTGPSGAHTEPWTYVVITDPEMKAQVRSIIEKEEQVQQQHVTSLNGCPELHFHHPHVHELSGSADPASTCMVAVVSVQINYERRMGEVWVNDLQKLRTNWEKPYLEIAPYLIIVFKQAHSYTSDGERKQHYYSEMSVCLSVGLMLAAIQVCLCAL